MINRNFSVDGDNVVVDGVKLSMTDLVFLVGFLGGVIAAKVNNEQAGQIDCPLTDEQYDLIDPDEDDDDEPEFPTAYDNPEGNPK